MDKLTRLRLSEQMEEEGINDYEVSDYQEKSRKKSYREDYKEFYSDIKLDVKEDW